MLTSQNALQAIFSAWVRGQAPRSWRNLGVQKWYFSILLEWQTISGKLLIVCFPLLLLVWLYFCLFTFLRSEVFSFWQKESSIKLLFDHFRNIGLCGAVFYAADFLVVNGAFPTSTLTFFPIAGALFLHAAALLGLTIQVLHFQNQIATSNTGRAHSYFVIFTNFVLVTALLQSIAFKKLPELFK